MRTLSKIKKDLEFNKGLSVLIETLKTIAVAQYRALEQRIGTFEDFFLSIESLFEFIDIKNINHPFLNSGNKPQIVVAVTSDSGLLGGLNMQVVNVAISEIEKISGKIIVIGERGKIYLRETGIPTVNFPGISEEERFGQSMQLRDYIINQVLTGSFGQVRVVYSRPISFAVQRVETLSFLPYSPSDKGKAQKGGISDIIMESSPQNMVEYLVYMWMGQKLYEIFGLSRLAEFAARYIHLEESAQKIKDIDKKVRLEYFRVRHELIDRTMRELFAARSLYANK